MKNKIFLKKNEDKRIISGHLWIFSNEILSIEGDPVSGDLFQVYNHLNQFIGNGFFNKNSLISVRILSSDMNLDIPSLFKQRIANANALRQNVYPNRNSYRMVFSESDLLPGLIIDKYNQSFVLQIYSTGIQKNISSIVNILEKDFAAENIFSKNDNYFRQLEGLPELDEIYFGRAADEIISDGKVKYQINFQKSQKTGFYFDQSDNRYFVEGLVGGKKVLDCFCNSGGFGLHAAMAGAATITFVDSSSNEIKTAQENYQMNKLNIDADFIIEDVFDYLERISNKKRYDVVMIDPPAFAKNKKSIAAAKKGYEKLNRLALNCLNENGWLVTSSCSHHLSQSDFLDVVQNASSKAERKLQLVHLNGASLDHPRLLAMPETSYLKFAVFRALN